MAKRISAVYGVVLFVWLSILLLMENPDPGVADTSLFFLGGQSVGLQAYRNLFDLPPAVMYGLYIVGLGGAVAGACFHKLYLIMPLVNAVLAVPIALVHYRTLLFNPFYMNGISDNLTIHSWCFWVWLAVIGLVFLFAIGLLRIFKKTT